MDSFIFEAFLVCYLKVFVSKPIVSVFAKIYLLPLTDQIHSRKERLLRIME